MALGASLVVLLQAAIAIVMVRYIFDNTFITSVLLRAGFVIFLIMMFYFLVMAQRKRREVEVTPTSGFKSVLKGLIIGALNIFPIPFFVALAAALNVNGDIDYHLLNNTAFVLAASMGTFTTLYLYALFFAKIEAEGTFFVKYSNYFMAALMLVLLLITFVRIYTQE